MSGSSPGRTSAASLRTPRLGFLGVGWIGRDRLQAIASSTAAQVAAIADADRERARAAQAATPSALVVTDIDGLFECGLDGIVIATPSAQHAEQAVAALERGLAVFCQKPLGRDARETRRVVEAARAADRLLGVDLSYRFTAGMQRIRERVQAGQLGSVFAAELVFHNAYGPDKPWFYERALSGGGCLVDLGVHLVDLALWTLGFPRLRAVSGRLLAAGRMLEASDGPVEDYASAQIELEGDTVVRLACSWGLAAGREAVIEASFYGTRGGASLRNVDGSFYDFRAEAFAGTKSTVLSEPPDAWSGRAAIDWAQRLACGERFDPETARLVQTAGVLDAIYADGLGPLRERSR